MPAYVWGMEAFGLDLEGLRKLGDRTTHVQLHLDTYQVTPSILALRPRARTRLIAAKAARWIAAIRRRFPKRIFEIEPGTSMPAFVEVTLAAREVQRLAAMKGIRSVRMKSVEGRRRARDPSPRPAWYCVRGLVVIEVEGQRRGMQAIEDRFVLVRASSPEEAKRRLHSEWRQYAQPYLNTDGEIVRWRLEEIKDIYETGETELNPAGVEVYSRLSSRRMKPPARGAAKR
jgi:Domain of unknown function (DUF4288)